MPGTLPPSSSEEESEDEVEPTKPVVVAAAAPAPASAPEVASDTVVNEEGAEDAEAEPEAHSAEGRSGDASLSLTREMFDRWQIDVAAASSTTTDE